MNPAPSIVLFTTLSGAGYGLLFWLGLFRPFGLTPPAPSFGLVALGLALALVTAGLLASLAHLGRPERAWRALSQWRSSWLSREGVAALATYVPAGLLGLGLLLGSEWLASLVGPLAAIGAAVTVWCTGMIYASLKTVRQWREPVVPYAYLLFAAFTGYALLAALSGFWDGPRPPATLAVLLGGAAFGVKMAYWQRIDGPAPAGSPTIETATGLGRIGRTRPLDPPHTEQTWLLREMAFRVARKHRLRLRRITLAGFATSTLLTAAALLLPAGIAAPLLVLGAILALAAMLIERWLVFAEATHTVALYYTGDA